MPALFLIRHAEPTLQGVFLGQLDPPLSPAGREHAAVALVEIEVLITYSSPLQRARETAGFLTSPQVIELPGLREIDYGAWTGKTWSEIETNWADLAVRKSTDWFNVPTPGGEEWAVFTDRVRTSWQLIRAGPSPAAVVAHQAVNSVLAHLIRGQDPLEFVQQYGEVIRVEYD